MTTYDAIVIGGGPGGTTCASALAKAGRSVALIERERVGGECAYWACMPSKTLLRAAQLRLSAAEAFAWRTANVDEYDDAEHARRLQGDGVTLLRGDARIEPSKRVRVGGDAYSYGALVIATGSEPEIPQIDGLADAPYWTTREATAAGAAPEELLILGGGAAGVELAQAFARLGSSVTIVERAPHILSDEEPEAAEILADALRDDGVRLVLGARAVRVRSEKARVAAELDDGSSLSCTQLLVSAGRRGRTKGFGLEALGVACDEKSGAVRVDEHCRAAPDVYAAGDVTGVGLFTHVAKYQGRIAAANILGDAAVAGYDAIPRCVYTEPEYAATGKTQRQAEDAGIDLVVASVGLDESARAVIYSRKPPCGTLKLVADRAARRLVGAAILGPMASEMVSLLSLAIRTRADIAMLADIVEPFPTFSEALHPALERLRGG